ncbi:chaperonin-like RbcX protein 2, chloroplastic [Vigna unguiculata]|uniref:chaperonin-like RbcX protein 2, chloroplastic n=1 Tax=Vigna unguiculata TaxID=3917 RepID=UPI001016D5E8|nr:chaperonin-like RbcX protein 2, chloroplastic [Vigna unguiculata]
MVGGVSVVVESHTCPCLCVEALSTTTTLSVVCNSLSLTLKRKHLQTRETMKLTTSFLQNHTVNTTLKNQSRHKKRTKTLTIVNELGGQYEDTFHDVKKQILNYFTYKAVRTVLNQLYEMNPPQYTWFYNFVATNDPADRKPFLRSLGKERHELAERVMITRLHLYGKWIKKCNHAEIYQEIHDENLELMRERLMETVIWPSDDSNT